MPDFRFWKDRPLDEETAWFCLVTNLTVLPGLGSLIAHRRVGYLQAGLALLGTALSLRLIWYWARQWLLSGQLPVAELGWELLGCLLGIGLFALAGLGGLVTGMRLVNG